MAEKSVVAFGFTSGKTFNAVVFVHLWEGGTGMLMLMVMTREPSASAGKF